MADIKKTIFRVIVVLILVSIFLVSSASVQATTPESLVITADMYLTGKKSAAGVFSTAGLFADSGSASEVFFTADGTIHGVKTLVSSEGTITIKFQARIAWTGPSTGVAEGQFVVVSGTGAYHKLHGNGETHAEMNLATYHIQAVYTGTAHFD